MEDDCALVEFLHPSDVHGNMSSFPWLDSEDLTWLIGLPETPNKQYYTDIFSADERNGAENFYSPPKNFSPKKLL